MSHVNIYYKIIFYCEYLDHIKSKNDFNPFYIQNGDPLASISRLDIYFNKSAYYYELEIKQPTSHSLHMLWSRWTCFHRHCLAQTYILSLFSIYFLQTVYLPLQCSSCVIYLILLKKNPFIFITAVFMFCLFYHVRDGICIML